MLLVDAVQMELKIFRKKSVLIHVDQGRDDSSPSALVHGGSQYAYTASPRAPRIWARLVA